MTLCPRRILSWLSLPRYYSKEGEVLESKNIWSRRGAKGQRQTANGVVESWCIHTVSRLTSILLIQHRIN